MKVVVIGGGASGMICAYYSAINGNQVILLEKNEKLGKKLYITGKGRCNITNDCDPTEFLNNIVTNGKFMMGSIYTFTPQDAMQLFENNGLNIKVERGNRVFPMSDKSSDVIKCLAKLVSNSGVEVRLNSQVTDIVVEKQNDTQKVKGVVVNGQNLLCDKVVVCTGGKSYVATGSTGDGYKFALKAGHTVLPARPCLVGLNLGGLDFSLLSGLSLKNISVTIFKNNKKIYSDFGEMLFTHTGVSGPVILSASSYISSVGCDNCQLSIDLKPALDEKTLDNRLLKDFGKYKNKQIKNSLDELLPKSLIMPIIKYANINCEKFTNEITAIERSRLNSALKNFKFDIQSLRPLDEAIVTGGGVSVKQINPKTMQSKLCEGLYFAGEVVDVDALTGGFNIQCALSMGYVAGNN